VVIGWSLQHSRDTEQASQIAAEDEVFGLFPKLSGFGVGLGL
jgi:hypothetical protein